MAKPCRMRCQRSGGEMVRSTSATGGAGATVALGPSNLLGADTVAGAGAGAAGLAMGGVGAGASEPAGGAAGCVSLSGADGVLAHAAMSAQASRARNPRG